MENYTDEFIEEMNKKYPLDAEQEKDKEIWDNNPDPEHIGYMIDVNGRIYWYDNFADVPEIIVRLDMAKYADMIKALGAEQ